MTAPANGRLIVALMTAVSAGSPLTYALFMPALIPAAAGMNVPVSTIQLTVATYLVTLAVLQPVYGPVSDRLGRRGPLLFGLALFALGSLAVGLATSIPVMIAGRVLQAVGMCAGIVLPRAVVRDRFGPERSPSILSFMGSVTGIAPATGPVIGGLLVEYFDWRAGLFVLAAYGALMFVGTWTSVPESHVPSGGPRLSILAAYRHLLRMPLFMGLALGSGLFFGSFFAIVTEAPFVMTGLLGLSPSQFGLAFAAMPLTYITTSFTVALLSRRVAPTRLIHIGGALGLFACAWVLWHALFSTLSLPLFLSWLMLVAVANGFLFSMSIAVAVGVDPRMIGTASGLLGTIHAAMSALGSVMAGVLHDGTVMATVWLIVLPMPLAPLLSWWATRPRPT